MIQLAVVAVLVVVLGGVVALSARDARLIVAGVVAAMIASPLAATPEPAALTFAFRLAGAVLAGYLLWVAALSQQIRGRGSRTGILTELAVAGAAFTVGWFVAPVKPLAGPVAAQAAGLSLAALAVAPAASRDVFRVGTAIVLLAIGVSLLLQAWAGPASGLEQIVSTMLLIGLVGATSLLISPSAVEPASSTQVGWPHAGEMAGEPAEPESASAQTPTEPEPAPPTDDIELTDDIDRRPIPARASRIVSPRALRRAAPRGTGGAGPAIDDAQAAPAQPSDAPVEITVRRLRPREPRR